MVAKSARFLAPIALIAVAVGVYLIVSAGLSTHHKTPTAPSAPLLGSGPHKRHARPRGKFYVVKPGDTLSAISIKTHVPISELTTHNPSISPTSLQTGQRLRLRR